MNKFYSNNNSFKFRNFELAVLLLIPVVFMLINDDWMFSPIGWVDAWYYVGYGLKYSDPSFLDGYYKISRLPWILFEHLARSNFDYYHASVILQLTLIIGTIFALYMAMLRTLGRVGAFFGTLFYATYTFSYASGGADYHNGCGGLFFALSWICALRAAETNVSVRWTVSTGVMVALSVHSIIVMANLVLIPIVFFLVHYKGLHDRWPPILKTILLGAVGAVAVTLLLCAINWSVGRNPWFFLLQFKLASSFVADSTHQSSWWHDWSTPWYLSTSRLYLFPAAAGLVASLPLAFYIWRFEKNPRRRNIGLIYSLLYTFYGLLWIFWQTIGQTSLDWVYFAYPLIFPLAGLVGAAAAVKAEKLDDELGLSLLPIAVVAVAIITAPFALYPHLEFAHTDTGLFILIGVGFLLLVLLLATLVGRLRPFVVSVVLCSLLMSVVSYNASRNEFNLFIRSTCHYDRQNLAAVVEANRFLSNAGRSFAQTLIWADPQEVVQVGGGCGFGHDEVPLSQFWPSLVTTGFSYLASPWDAKKLGDIAEKRLQEAGEKRSLVVLLSNSPALADELHDRFAALPGAVPPGPVESHQLENRPVKLYYFGVGPDAKP